MKSWIQLCLLFAIVSHVLHIKSALMCV